jgi:hypothetical protein
MSVETGLTKVLPSPPLVSPPFLRCQLSNPLESPQVSRQQRLGNVKNSFVAVNRGLFFRVHKVGEIVFQMI